MRSLRGYDEAMWSIQHGRDTGDESLVQQHFREEVDINQIAKRFGLTPNSPMGSAAAAVGVYGDFTGILDYEDAVSMIRRTDEAFMRLPPDVRERFGNDPGRLVEFASALTPEQLQAEFAPPEEPAVPAPVVPVAET